MWVFGDFSSMERGFFILPLGFKFQNIPFPIPTLLFFLLAFPKHKPAAAGPGSWLSASTQQSVWEVCFVLLHHVESFPLAISFYNVVLVGKPPWARKGPAPREAGRGISSRNCSVCSLGWRNYHVLNFCGVQLLIAQHLAFQTPHSGAAASPLAKTVRSCATGES